MSVTLSDISEYILSSAFNSLSCSSSFITTLFFCLLDEPKITSPVVLVPRFSYPFFLSLLSSLGGSSKLCSRTRGWLLVCSPSLTSSSFGRFHKLALNFARRSSKATACRKVRTIVLDVVNGNLLGIMPTESTVSLLNGSIYGYD